MILISKRTKFLFLFLGCALFSGQIVLGGELRHPPPQEATASLPWRNAGVLRSLMTRPKLYAKAVGGGGLERRAESKGSPRRPFTATIEHTVNSTFAIKGAKNLGTGFFISSTGYGITCGHVIEENGDHTAVLNDRSEFPVGVIAKSDRYDLALILVITPRKTTFLSMCDPSAMTPGERLFAIGNTTDFQPTVTDGFFAGFRKKMPAEQKVIQFTAPIHPGNSGGPLIDEQGRVVGVVSWKMVADRGIPVKGAGFAVPAEYLMEEYGRYVEQTVSFRDEQ